MPRDVIAHEARNEIVGVVISRLHAELQIHTGVVAELLKPLWLQLFAQEIVGIALIDQNVAGPAAGPQQCAGGIVGPARPVSPR